MQILLISGLKIFIRSVCVGDLLSCLCTVSAGTERLCASTVCQLANQDRFPPFYPAWLWVAPRFSVTAPPLGLEVPTECLGCSSMSRFSSVTVMVCEVVHSMLTVSGHERFQFGGTVWIPDTTLPSDSLLSCMFCFVTTVTPALQSKGYFNISILWILDAFPKEFCNFFFSLWN